MRPLVGGASSLTFQGLMSGERVVVKVAPAGHEPVGYRDVLRQARMLEALRLVRKLAPLVPRLELAPLTGSAE